MYVILIYIEVNSILIVNLTQLSTSYVTEINNRIRKFLNFVIQ